MTALRDHEPKAGETVDTFEVSRDVLRGIVAELEELRRRTLVLAKRLKREARTGVVIGDTGDGKGYTREHYLAEVLDDAAAWNRGTGDFRELLRVLRSFARRNLTPEIRQHCRWMREGIPSMRKHKVAGGGGA